MLLVTFSPFCTPSYVHRINTSCVKDANRKIITARVRSTTGGYVFTLFTIWGGGVPTLRSGWGGYLLRSGWGVPICSGSGGTYLLGGGGGVPTLRSGWGVPTQVWMGGTYLGRGRGVGTLPPE